MGLSHRGQWRYSTHSKRHGDGGGADEVCGFFFGCKPGMGGEGVMGGGERGVGGTRGGGG